MELGGVPEGADGEHGEPEGALPVPVTVRGEGAVLTPVLQRSPQAWPQCESW